MKNITVKTGTQQNEEQKAPHFELRQTDIGKNAHNAVCKSKDGWAVIQKIADEEALQINHHTHRDSSY